MKKAKGIKFSDHFANKACELIFDNETTKNCISKTAVDNLNSKVGRQPYPYKVGLVKKGTNTKVTQLFQALGSLGVEKLVIPAISELIDTWTNVFGFKPIKESKQRELRNINMLVFPGIDMLHKPLVKHQVSEGSLNPTIGLISRNEVLNNSETSSSSRPDINISVDGNAPRVQPESGSQPPDGSLNDTSDITSEMVNVNPESSIDLNVNPKFSIDLNVNLDGADKTDCCEASIKGTDIVADTLPQCNSGEDSGSLPEQPVSKIQVDQMSKTQCNSESMRNLSSGSGAMEVVP